MPLSASINPADESERQYPAPAGRDPLGQIPFIDGTVVCASADHDPRAIAPAATMPQRILPIIETLPNLNASIGEDCDENRLALFEAKTLQLSY